MDAWLSGSLKRIKPIGMKTGELVNRLMKEGNRRDDEKENKTHM
jgi:hypothetical protein